MITPEFHEKLRAQLMPLIERNFINKQKNRYLITETGRHFLEKLWPIIEQVDYVISSGFSEEEIAALARSF